MRTILCEISDKYGSDKNLTHDYTWFYHYIFLFKRESVKRVLEIGILKGASLYTWREYFPSAEIYGIDINRESMITDEERIHTFVSDQTSESDTDGLYDLIGGDFDIIIDDGSHRSDDQIKSYALFKRFLKPGGIYIIEDVRFPNRVVNGTGGKLFDFGQKKSPYKDNRLVIII